MIEAPADWIPLEALTESERWSSSTLERARSTIDEGWRYSTFPPVELRVPIDWRSAASEHRSWKFNLHAWEFMGPVLAAFEHTKELPYLEWCARVAADWIENYPTYDLDDDMAWYDMAVGLRAYRLGYVIDALRRSGETAKETRSVLESAVTTHYEAFGNHKQFAVHSNHGLYFAAGQAALARRTPAHPESERNAVVAANRLGRVLARQFATDGVHKEHSPAYHAMLFGTVRTLASAGLIPDDAVGATLTDIESALGWFVTPDGTLVQFGDTARKSIAEFSQSNWTSPELRYVASRGEEGAPPRSGAATFLESGYWIVRGEREQGSYLALTAAFHSRVHKHADDMSVVWWDRGAEILADPGRYGYVGSLAKDDPQRDQGFFYGHPARQFVESTRAHNALEIDGRDYERKGVTPYGSALRHTGQHGDVYCSVSSAVRFEGIEHVRAIALVPGKWLVLWDLAVPADDAEHTYAQRLSFAPEVSVRETEAGLRASVPHWEHALHAIPLTPGATMPITTGATEPMLGWVSRQDGQLESAPSTGVAITTSGTASLATLLAFEDVATDVRNVRCVRSSRRSMLTFVAGDDEVSVQVKKDWRGRTRVRARAQRL